MIATHSKQTEIAYQQALDFPKAILSEAEKEDLKARFRQLLIAHNAILIAHFYVDQEIQQLADETGGCVSDSLEMARFGKESSAENLIVAGVRFMGETAKILSPDKRVLMPTLAATCSLDLDCSAQQFAQFRQQYPDRVAVVYANTSAAVKAQADWVVTSSIALDVVKYLHQQNKKILWAPDRYLGHYVQQQTGADLVIWQGSCVVHEEFKLQGILDLKQEYPDAGVLVHPESPEEVVDIADMVGSTSQLIAAGKDLPHQVFIVSTDKGLFYKMQQAAPSKKFLIAPTGGRGATCKSCAHCPWMEMNQLNNLVEVFDNHNHEIKIDRQLQQKALVPLQRMLEFKHLR